MKIAVTGASGLVGSNLVPALLGAGYDIRILGHNNLKSFDAFPVPMVKGDLMDRDSLREFVDGADIVVHLAAKISMTKKSKETLEINIKGTENLLEISRDLSVGRFIYFSSIHSYYPFPLDEELNEMRSLNQSSEFDYDKSKAISQEMVLEANSPDFNCIVLCPTAILGPGDFKPAPLGRAVLELYKGKIPALLDGGYNWVDIRDIVEGTIKAIRYAEAGQAYLLSGHWKNLYDLAREVAANGGKDPPPFTVPFWLARIGAGILNILTDGRNGDKLFTSTSLDTLQHSPKFISHQKATNDFRYNPRSFQDTIRDLIIYYRKIGLI